MLPRIDKPPTFDVEIIMTERIADHYGLAARWQKEMMADGLELCDTVHEFNRIGSTLIQRFGSTSITGHSENDFARG